jgi:hypothetical protein
MQFKIINEAFKSLWDDFEYLVGKITNKMGFDSQNWQLDFYVFLIYFYFLKSFSSLKLIPICT